MFKNNNQKVLHSLKKNDNAYIYALSFLLPLFLVLLIYIIKGIYPFGNRAFLRMDLYHQYLPFHAELSEKLKNFRSLLYTYNVGLGTNFLSLFAYYLSCPLNIFLFFVSKKNVIEFLGYVTILKIALSSLTFSYYLTHKYKESNYLIVAFSIFYGMSGYICAYYWNVMWLDNVVLLPLLLLSFEKMFYKNDARLYIPVLALSILCNYYIATLTCFFLILYFVFLLFYSNQHNVKFIVKKVIYISIYSIIGILMSFVLLLPVFMAFSYTASSDFGFPETIYEFFPILDAIARHLPFVKIENGIDEWPNIYCGVCSIALVIYYFLSKKNNIKKKLIIFISILFFMSSFCINIVSFILHVCRYPNSLPARFSMIYIAFILCIGYYSIRKIDKIDIKNMVKAFVLSILLVIFLQKTVENVSVKFESFIVAIILLLIYMMLFICYKNKCINKIVVISVAIFVICFEAFINMHSTSITTVNRNEYIKKVDSIEYLTKYIGGITDDFYRVEIDNRTSKDDGAFYNFPSASIFSSSCYKKGSDLYKKLGMEASMNAYSITGSTPFCDSLLGVKYFLYDKKIDYDKEIGLRLLEDDGSMYLYENLYALPLSFVMPNVYVDGYDFGGGNPATAQNNFSRLYNKKILLEPIDIHKDGIHVNFICDDDGDYYAFVLDKSIDEISYHHNTTDDKFTNVKRGYFLELGYLKKGDSCGLTNNTNEKDLLVQVFKFRHDNLNNLVNLINKDSEFHINYFDDTRMSYTLNANIDGRAIITLPYDDGWDIYVDGKKIDKKEVFDFFLSFDMKKGTHEVVLNYMPQGLKIGILASIIGIFLYLAYCYRFVRLDNSVNS